VRGITANRPQPIHNVILSAAWPSRSEGRAESKDPYFHMHSLRRRYCVYIMGSITRAPFTLGSRAISTSGSSSISFIASKDSRTNTRWNGSFTGNRSTTFTKPLPAKSNSNQGMAQIEELDLAGDCYPWMKDSGTGRGASTPPNNPLRGSSCSAQQDKG
jgi:hypothetical protein